MIRSAREKKKFKEERGPLYWMRIACIACVRCGSEKRLDEIRNISPHKS